MIKQLCKEIETALNHQIKTPKDFIFLRDNIYSRLHVLVSRTTLMRIWGYLSEDVKPRVGTLSILAEFLGYRNWEDYCRNAVLPKEEQSNPVLNRRLSVTSALDPGDCIRLTWQPDRVCDIEYIGNLTFRVMASQNTRLHKGDTFQCCMIIEGEPLYLDKLIQGDAHAIAYVCGKKSGVRYESLLPHISQE